MVISILLAVLQKRGGEHFSYLLVWKWLNDFSIHLIVEYAAWCVQPDRPGFLSLPLPKIEMLTNFCFIWASLSQMLNFKNADNTSDYSTELMKGLDTSKAFIRVINHSTKSTINI